MTPDLTLDNNATKIRIRLITDIDYVTNSYNISKSVFCSIFPQERKLQLHCNVVQYTIMTSSYFTCNRIIGIGNVIQNVSTNLLLLINFLYIYKLSAYFTFKRRQAKQKYRKPIKELQIKTKT